MLNVLLLMEDFLVEELQACDLCKMSVHHKLILSVHLNLSNKVHIKIIFRILENGKTYFYPKRIDYIL